MSATLLYNHVNMARTRGTSAAKWSKKIAFGCLDNCRGRRIQPSAVCERYLLPLLALLAASVSWLLVVPLSLIERREAMVTNTGRQHACDSRRTHVLIRDDCPSEDDDVSIPAPAPPLC